SEKERIWTRFVLIMGACVLYILAEARFNQAYRGTIFENSFAQIKFVFKLLPLLAPLMFLPAIPVINLAVLGTQGLLLFIALGIGPDFTLLIPVQIPLLVAVTLQLQTIQAIFWILFSDGTILAALQPHKSWGEPVNAGTLYQGLLYAALTAIVSALFLLLKNQSNRLTALQAAVERLDRAYQKVVDANLDFQTYALFAREEAMEKERRRLAGELHDIIGYSLTNVIMLIQAAQIGKGDSEQTHAILEKARLHADESLREARQTLAALRTEAVERPRGANLFLKLTKTFQEVTGILINIDFANMPSELPAEVEKLLYRLIQEGLTNAFRHGKASEVHISFWYDRGNLTIITGSHHTKGIQ
ncbi:MAG TPA: histidine kinase, partial [Treponema sp.]|nr:histidine kinase [Treponema sp.]